MTNVCHTLVTTLINIFHCRVCVHPIEGVLVILIIISATAADGFNLYLTAEDGRAINFVSSTSKE